MNWFKWGSKTMDNTDTVTEKVPIPGPVTYNCYLKVDLIGGIQKAYATAEPTELKAEEHYDHLLKWYTNTEGPPIYRFGFTDGQAIFERSKIVCITVESRPVKNPPSITKGP